MKLSVLFLSAFMVVSAIVNTSIAQTGDEVIDKHIAAIGGEKRWNKVTSIKLIGTASMNGMDVPFSKTFMNKKWKRWDFSPEGVDCFYVVTEDDGWMYMPSEPRFDKVMPLPKEMLTKALRMLNYRHTLLVDKSEIVDAKYLGIETINGKSCLKLDITDAYENRITAFFDVKTYYLLRTEIKQKRE